MAHPIPKSITITGNIVTLVVTMSQSGTPVRRAITPNHTINRDALAPTWLHIKLLAISSVNETPTKQFYRSSRGNIKLDGEGHRVVLLK